MLGGAVRGGVVVLATVLVLSMLSPSVLAVTDTQRHVSESLSSDVVASHDGIDTGDNESYYQIDFVQGEPIEQLGPASSNNFYSRQNRLIRYLHGSTANAVESRGTSSPSQRVQDCIDSDPMTVNDDSVSITFTVQADCQIEMSLVAMAKVGTGFSFSRADTQELHDHETRNLSAGTYTFTVDLPPGDDDDDGEENMPPSARFTWSPETPRVGASTTFDATNSTDSDGSITTYRWDLGDDGSFDRTGATIEHVFLSDKRTESVRLRVVDDDGATSDIVKNVDINQTRVLAFDRSALELKAEAYQALNDSTAPTETPRSLLNNSFRYFVGLNRVSNGTVFDLESDAVLQLDNQESVVRRLVEADRRLSYTAINDVQRVRRELERRGIAFDEATVASALSEANQSFDEGEDFRGQEGRAIQAIARYRESWKHATAAIDVMDEATTPRINLTRRDDPIRNASENYSVAGTVFDVQAYELGNVSITSPDGVATSTSGFVDADPTATARFSATVALSAPPNDLTIRVTDPDDDQQATGHARLKLDGDGLPDRYETNISLTDPLDNDSDSTATAVDESDNDIIDSREDFDGDNLTTRSERDRRLSPHDDDTDDDRLTDYQEIVYTDQTDPRRADTDSDGVPDAEEDDDGDGISNLEELNRGAFPDFADSDGDGLSDAREFELGTDPISHDSDGDGLSDTSELKPAISTDPTSPDSNGDGVLDGNSSYRTTARNDSLGTTVSVLGEGDIGQDVTIRSGRQRWLRNNATRNASVSPFVSVTTYRNFTSANLTIDYNASQISNESNTSLAIYRLNESTQHFDRIPSTVDTQANEVTANVTKFSTFIVYRVRAWESLFEGPSVSGASEDVVYLYDTFYEPGGEFPESSSDPLKLRTAKALINRTPSKHWAASVGVTGPAEVTAREIFVDRVLHPNISICTFSIVSPDEEPSQTFEDGEPSTTCDPVVAPRTGYAERPPLGQGIRRGVKQFETSNRSKTIIYITDPRRGNTSWPVVGNGIDFPGVVKDSMLDPAQRPLDVTVVPIQIDAGYPIEGNAQPNLCSQLSLPSYTGGDYGFGSWDATQTSLRCGGATTVRNASDVAELTTVTAGPEEPGILPSRVANIVNASRDGDVMFAVDSSLSMKLNDPNGFRGQIVDGLLPHVDESNRIGYLEQSWRDPTTYGILPPQNGTNAVKSRLQDLDSNRSTAFFNAFQDRHGVEAFRETSNALRSADAILGDTVFRFSDPETLTRSLFEAEVEPDRTRLRDDANVIGSQANNLRLRYLQNTSVTLLPEGELGVTSEETPPFIANVSRSATSIMRQTGDILRSRDRFDAVATVEQDHLDVEFDETVSAYSVRYNGSTLNLSSNETSLNISVANDSLTTSDRSIDLSNRSSSVNITLAVDEFKRVTVNGDPVTLDRDTAYLAITVDTVNDSFAFAGSREYDQEIEANGNQLRKIAAELDDRILPRFANDTRNASSYLNQSLRFLENSSEPLENSSLEDDELALADALARAVHYRGVYKVQPRESGFPGRRHDLTHIFGRTNEYHGGSGEEGEGSAGLGETVNMTEAVASGSLVAHAVNETVFSPDPGAGDRPDRMILVTNVNDSVPFEVVPVSQDPFGFAPVSAFDERVVRSAEFAESSGVRIDTVGVGGADDELLGRVSDETGGSFHELSEDGDPGDVPNLLEATPVEGREDSDGDGLPDAVEESFIRLPSGELVTTDPNDPDTDGDGLEDGFEVEVDPTEVGGDRYHKISSHPRLVDTDGDGIDDETEEFGWEQKVEVRDGEKYRPSVNSTLFTYHSDPLARHSDVDNLADGAEKDVYETDAEDECTYSKAEQLENIMRKIERHNMMEMVGSTELPTSEEICDPLEDQDFVLDDSASTPMDRLTFEALDGTLRTDVWYPNQEEERAGSGDDAADPKDPDTDDDGLTDGWEDKHLTAAVPTSRGYDIRTDTEATFNTESNDPDTDGDDYWDGWIGVYGIEPDRSDKVVKYLENVNEDNNGDGEAGLEGNQITPAQAEIHTWNGSPHSKIHIGELSLESSPTKNADVPSSDFDVDLHFYEPANEERLNQTELERGIEKNFDLYGLNVDVHRVNTFRDATFTVETVIGAFSYPLSFNGFSRTDSKILFDQKSQDNPVFLVLDRPGGFLAITDVIAYKDIGSPHMALFTERAQDELINNRWIDQNRIQSSPYTNGLQLIAATAMIHEIGHKYKFGLHDDGRTECGIPTSIPSIHTVVSGEVYTNGPCDGSIEPLPIQGQGQLRQWSGMSRGFEQKYARPMNGRYIGFTIEELSTVQP